MIEERPFQLECSVCQQMYWQGEQDAFCPHEHKPWSTHCSKHCECGRWSGVNCEVHGPVTEADFVKVEVGAERLRVYRKCAAHMVESDPRCKIVEASP
jgi:hypothetical protein